MTIAACPPSTTPIPGVVVFDQAEFLALYPQFSTVSAALAGNFALATLQLNNSCCSRVQDANARQTLLYLLTAHITRLINGENGVLPAGVVGRINAASEGSVSVSADMGNQQAQAAYYMQTQYGALFWQSTASYRTFAYVPAPQVNYGFPGDLYQYGGPGFGGGGPGCCGGGF